MKQILLAALILLSSVGVGFAAPAKPLAGTDFDIVRTFFDRQQLGFWTIVGFNFIAKHAPKKYMSTCTMYTTFTSQVTNHIIYVGLNLRVSDLDHKKEPEWYFNIISDGFEKFPRKFTSRFTWEKFNGERKFVVAHYLKASDIMILLTKLPEAFVNEVFSGHSKYIEFSFPHKNYLQFVMKGTETALDLLKTCTKSYVNQYVR